MTRSAKPNRAEAIAGALKARRPTGPSHAQLQRAGQAVPNPGAPLVLANDDRLVRACLEQGGFPTAVQTSVGTVWAGPDGMPWTGARGRSRKRKAAR